MSRSRKGNSSINSFYKGNKMNEDRFWGPRGKGRSCSYKAGKWIKRVTAKMERALAKRNLRR